MKSIKLLLSAIAIMLGGLAMNANAQCVASFSFDTTASASGTLFYSTYNNMGSTYYDWSFSGGTPSNPGGMGQDSVIVSFPSNGWYTVCLTIWDSVAMCGDTLCDSVYILGTAPVYASTSSTNATCGNCNGTASVNASGGAAPYTYLWSNGATTQTITGLCSGTYSVTVTDNTGNSDNSSVTIGNTSAVMVTASSTSNNCTSAQVSANATGGTAPYSYSWMYGGSVVSTSSSAAVSNAGAYVVNVTDANGCSGMDSVWVTFAPAFTLSASSTNETCLTCCDGTAAVSVSGGPVNQPFTYTWSNGATGTQVSGLCPGTYSVVVLDTLNGCSETTSVTIGAYSCPILSGQITQGQSGPAMVYLIQESNNVLTAVDSVVTDSMGYYYFDACPGTYYVKAALMPSHSQYSYFLPTYYVNSSLWGLGTAVVVSSNTSGININMLTGTNPGGPGFIGGSVAQGANRGEGDPVVDAQVVLRNTNDEVVAFTRTDVNGEYEFNNIAYGDYKVDIDLLNFESYPFMVFLAADNETVVDRNFVVEGGAIKPVTPTGVNELSALDFEVYPNPTSAMLNLNGEISKVEIFNILGESVMTQTNAQVGNMNMNVSALAAGQYIVKVTTDEASNYVQIVVQ